MSELVKTFDASTVSLSSNGKEPSSQPIPDEPQTPVTVALQPIKPDLTRKVAIVGTSHSWDKAPFDDTTVEIWGVNNGYLQLSDKRKSRWFDVHCIEHRPDGKWYRRWKPEFRGMSVNEYIEQLGKLNCPVYMQQTWPEIPNSRRFPLERVTGYFGRYITNSISMQIAYALSEGFGDIQLWGVDMSAGTEWAYQRPNAEYFIGIAIALGARVLVPAESDLLKTNFMYAFEERDKSDYIKKADMLERKVNEKMDKTASEIIRLEKELEFRRKTLEQYVGSKQGIKEMKQLWTVDLNHWHYPE